MKQMKQFLLWLSLLILFQQTKGQYHEYSPDYSNRKSCGVQDPVNTVNVAFRIDVSSWGNAYLTKLRQDQRYDASLSQNIGVTFYCDAKYMDEFARLDRPCCQYAFPLQTIPYIYSYCTYRKQISYLYQPSIPQSIGSGPTPYVFGHNPPNIPNQGTSWIVNGIEGRFDSNLNIIDFRVTFGKNQYNQMSYFESTNIWYGQKPDKNNQYSQTISWRYYYAKSIYPSYHEYDYLNQLKFIHKNGRIQEAGWVYYSSDGSYINKLTNNAIPQADYKSIPQIVKTNRLQINQLEIYYTTTEGIVDMNVLFYSTQQNEWVNDGVKKEGFIQCRIIPQSDKQTIAGIVFNHYDTYLWRIRIQWSTRTSPGNTMTANWPKEIGTTADLPFRDNFYQGYVCQVKLCVKEDILLGYQFFFQEGDYKHSGHYWGIENDSDATCTNYDFEKNACITQVQVQFQNNLISYLKFISWEKDVTFGKKIGLSYYTFTRNFKLSLCICGFRGTQESSTGYIKSLAPIFYQITQNSYKYQFPQYQLKYFYGLFHSDTSKKSEPSLKFQSSHTNDAKNQKVIKVKICSNPSVIANAVVGINFVYDINGVEREDDNRYASSDCQFQLYTMILEKDEYILNARLSYYEKQYYLVKVQFFTNLFKIYKYGYMNDDYFNYCISGHYFNNYESRYIIHGVFGFYQNLQQQSIQKLAFIVYGVGNNDSIYNKSLAKIHIQTVISGNYNVCRQNMGDNMYTKLIRQGYLAINYDHYTDAEFIQLRRINMHYIYVENGLKHLQTIQFGFIIGTGSIIIEPIFGSKTHSNNIASINLNPMACIYQVILYQDYPNMIEFGGASYLYRDLLGDNLTGVWSVSQKFSHQSTQPIFFDFTCVIGHAGYFCGSDQVALCSTAFHWQYNSRHFQNYFMDKRIGISTVIEKQAISYAQRDNSYITIIKIYKASPYISGFSQQYGIGKSLSSQYIQKIYETGAQTVVQQSYAYDECIVQAFVTCYNQCNSGILNVAFHSTKTANFQAGKSTYQLDSQLTDRSTGNLTQNMCISGIYGNVNGNLLTSVGFYYRYMPHVNIGIEWMPLQTQYSSIPQSSFSTSTRMKFIDRYLQDINNHIIKITIKSFFSINGLVDKTSTDKKTVLQTQNIVNYQITYNNHASDLQGQIFSGNVEELTTYTMNENECIYAFQIFQSNGLIRRIYLFTNEQVIFSSIKPNLEVSSTIFQQDFSLNKCIIGFYGYFGASSQICDMAPIFQDKQFFNKFSSLPLNINAKFSEIVGTVATDGQYQDFFCFKQGCNQIVALNVWADNEGIYGMQFIYRAQLYSTYNEYDSPMIGRSDKGVKTVVPGDCFYEVVITPGASGESPILGLSLQGLEQKIYLGFHKKNNKKVFNYLLEDKKLWCLAGFLGTVNADNQVSSIQAAFRLDSSTIYDPLRFQEEQTKLMAGSYLSYFKSLVKPQWNVKKIEVCMSHQQISGLQITYIYSKANNYALPVVDIIEIGDIRIEKFVGTRTNNCKSIHLQKNENITDYNFSIMDSPEGGLTNLFFMTNFKQIMKFGQQVWQAKDKYIYKNQFQNLQGFYGRIGSNGQIAKLGFIDYTGQSTQPTAQPTAQPTQAKYAQSNLDIVKTNILAFRTKFYATIRNATLIDAASIAVAMATVTTELNLLRDELKSELLKIDIWAEDIKKIDWTQSIWKIWDSIKKILETESYKEIMRVLEDEIFTYENLKTRKYVRAYQGYMDPEAAIRQDGSFGGTVMFDAQKWLSYEQDTVILSYLSLPGTYNSASGTLETLYKDYAAVPLLFQTQPLLSTLTTQFNNGVRSFDLRVNYYHFTESDFTKKNQHYYCDYGALKNDPMNCLDFRLMADVFPLGNDKFQTIMSTLLQLLTDNPTEFIILRLTCEPDFACVDDWNMLVLIDYFFKFYQPFTVPKNGHIVQKVDQLYDIPLSYARGKILITFKSFPEGYSSNLWDLCMPGYDFQQSEWVTYSSTNYYYEIDNVQQRDTWDYSEDVTQMVVHDLAEMTLLLSRHSDSLDAIEKPCTRVLSTHAGSYLLPPKYYNNVFREQGLIAVLGLTQNVGIIFQDFVTAQDVLTILGSTATFNKHSMPSTRTYEKVGNDLNHIFLTSQNQEYKYGQFLNKISIQKKAGTSVLDLISDNGNGSVDIRIENKCQMTTYDCCIVEKSSTTEYQTSASISQQMSGIINNYVQDNYPTKHNYKVFNYDPNIIDGIMTLFDSGTLAIYDQNCHCFYLASGHSFIGPANAVSTLTSPNKENVLSIDKTTQTTTLKKNALTVHTWTLDTNLAKSKIPALNLLMLEQNGDLNLGGLQVIFRRYHKKTEKRKLPEQVCYQLSVEDDGNIVLYHKRNHVIWSLAGSSQYEVYPFLYKDETLSSTKQLNMTGNGGTFTLNVLQGKTSGFNVKLGNTIINQFLSSSVDNGDDQRWLLQGSSCALQLKRGDTDTLVEASSNVHNMLVAPLDGEQECVLELTQEGEVKIYSRQDPDTFVFYLQNAIKLHLHELSILDSIKQEPTFKDQIIYHGQEIVFEDQLITSTNGKFQIKFMKATGQLHIYFVDLLLDTPITTTSSKHTIFISDANSVQPTTLYHQVDGGISIKDNAGTVIFSNQQTVSSQSTPPYYLILGNDGSLIQYDSTGAAKAVIAPYNIGLNMMLLNHNYRSKRN